MRSPPNAFGTSLIDLLVGVLCMVALLWVLQARNSGLTGEGEVERVSAFALVEQYGGSHLATVSFGQEGAWSCRFKLDRTNDTLSCENESQTSVSLDPPLPWGGDGGKLLIRTIEGNIVDPPMEVRIRKSSGNNSFIGGLNIYVDRLADRPVAAEVAIDICCELVDPHYLRLFSLSPSGSFERHMFWHEAGALKLLLACAGNNRNGSCPTGLEAGSAKWVTSTLADLAAGRLTLAPGSFVFMDPSWEASLDDLMHQPLSYLKDRVEHCMNARATQTAQVKIRFDLDGDVTVSTPDTTEARSQAGQPIPPVHGDLLIGFNDMLARFSIPPGTPP